MLVQAGKGLRELFFPRRCLVCGGVLEQDEQDICSACLEELPLTYQWDIVQNAAFERLARRFEVEDAAALFFFGAESGYRKILYGIKYGGRRRLGWQMGYLLGTYLAGSRSLSGCRSPAGNVSLSGNRSLSGCRSPAGSRSFEGCQAVVPVPLHPLRRWKRGYNQAEDIARGVAAAMGLPLETALLRRRRHTRTQTRLS